MRYLLRSISDLRNGQGREEIARFALGEHMGPRTMCAMINQSTRLFAQNGT